MTERKGASYKITAKRPAQTHAEHTQRTGATAASEMYTSRSSYSYGPMDIRAREYDEARSGKMSVEQMRRVDINPDKL